MFYGLDYEFIYSQMYTKYPVATEASKKVLNRSKVY